jgi:hypothetical protein
MGVKISCVPSFELQTPSPPLTLDTNLEGLEPLEISIIVYDGHAPNPKKQNKYEIFKCELKISRSLGFENAMGKAILNDVGLVTFIKCWV